jgi:hypothetical protein
VDGRHEIASMAARLVEAAPAEQPIARRQCDQTDTVRCVDREDARLGLLAVSGLGHRIPA